jgi:hypothetical protein
MRMVSHIPDVKHWDPSPGVHWRPGVLWAIAGANATLRVNHYSGGFIDRVVLTSALPAGLKLGQPVACRFTSEAYDPVAQIEPGGWSTAPRDEVAAVAAGIFTIGIIPNRITKLPTEHAWTRRTA